MFSKIEQTFLDRGRARKAYQIQNVVKFVEFFYRLRWFQTYWIETFLENELRAMSLMQAEVADTETVHRLEKLKKLSGNLAKEEDKLALQKAQERLLGYDKDWWVITSRYHLYLFYKPKGCYIRQLNLYRHGYLGFTEEQVQNACKAVGGCCAYECGCCYRDRGSSRMSGVLMHCMRECGCCLQRRGPGVTFDGECKEALFRILVDYWNRNGVRK